MRILQVDTGREMRGGQWQVFYLAKGLVDAGHETVILAPKRSPLYAKVAAEGLPVQALELPRLMRERPRFDIVHAHTARAHTLAVLAGANPLIVSRRVAFPIRQGCGSRWKYSRPARFIAVSEHVKRTLIAADVSESRISVVYDGVPLLERSRALPLAVAPATDDPRKGSAQAAEAAQLARIALRFSADLDSDLREAGMFVYITEEEGLGSAVLLAMSAGVPVIASRMGGLFEIVEDGVNGFLTDNAPAAIAGCMRRISDNWESAKEMGQQGRLTVERRFSSDQMIAGTLRVYQEVRAGK